MAITKTARINDYNAQLMRMQTLADSASYHIDSDPDYIALVGLITDYEFGERRFCPAFKQEVFNLRRAVCLRVEMSIIIFGMGA